MRNVVSKEIRDEAADLLYYEASLLEQDRLQEWLELFTDDVRYWMPVRETVHGARGNENHIADTEDLSFRLFDEDKESLELRVQRLDTGMAHTETPPSITQRLITNVRVEETEEPDEIIAHSNFLVQQIRHQNHDSLYIGNRKDRFRRINGEWKIASRRIVLAQPTLPRALAIFF